MIVPTPDGYDSWLDYAIATMDTRSEYNRRIAEGCECERSDMRESALAELDELRKRK